jgi:small ligand-binding sensory domain FIST
MIRCAEGLSTEPDTGAAIDEALGQVEAGHGGEPGDLALIFASIHHADGLARAARAVRDRGLGRAAVLGCTCESVVGAGREVEGGPALAVWSASLPGAVVEPMAINHEEPPSVETEGADALLVLGDPFRFDADAWLRRLGAELPGLRAFGGMASGGHRMGEDRLVLDGAFAEQGAVGVALRGVTIDSVVSQGCRPIGRPMIVTKVEGNIIRELGRRPALAVFQEVYAGLSPEDQERVRSGLHLGQVIDEYRESFGRGDFLVRNVLGADREGGIAVGDLVRVGRTVQFHVRDAESADEDLRHLADAAAGAEPVAGALLFTCNGRGSRLFAGPDHDVSALRERIGPVPIAGFFARGEIGPIGGHNFVHGFTASVALFRKSR